MAKKKKRFRRKPGAYDPLNPPEVKVIAAWSTEIPVEVMQHIIHRPESPRPWVVVWRGKKVGFFKYKGEAVERVKQLRKMDGDDGFYDWR